MFTGIIKATGTVGQIRPQGGDTRLTIRSAALPWRDFVAGDSISVNGVCLTIVDLLEDGFTTDVSAETLDVTALGDLTSQARVNLEPALNVGDRLGGHLVSGHVDCVGRVADLVPAARSTRLSIGLPDGYRRYLAKKGSICVDGVSLTINEVSGNAFDVNIIPHTAATTVIGGYRKGAKVNIEVDLIARYLESLLQNDGEGSRISPGFLRAHGYA
jgi:riboflavin synthase